MCGRAYETYTDEELSFRYLNKRFAPVPDFLPNYNLYPTQSSVVVRTVNGERTFDAMQWQLIPDWEASFKTKLSTINARSETVFESRVYRNLIVRQRCILPLSGFFEWKRGGKSPRPFKIFLKDESIMSVAGVWDTWHPGASDERRSFSILTTAANGFMSGIHDRMPVILSRSEEDDWLNAEIHQQDFLRTLLKSCPSSWLAAVEVSPLVNSPKNNSSAVLEPVGSATTVETRSRLLFD
jgi:putative SOS response-associated peptidase YedK